MLQEGYHLIEENAQKKREKNVRLAAIGVTFLVMGITSYYTRLTKGLGGKFLGPEDLQATAVSSATECLIQAGEHEAAEAASQGIIRTDTSGLVDSLETRVSGSTPYAKEFGLLVYVLAQARPGDPFAASEAQERYADEVLRPGCSWLKIMGGTKADLLSAAVRMSPPNTGGVLEVGTYTAYSAMRMTLAQQKTRVTTLEVDPVHVVISRRIVSYAGLDWLICVLTGHSKDLLPRMAAGLGGPGFGTVFMDQRGSRKESDLAFMERSEMIEPGAVIIADNVLKPGAPLFLWRVVKGGAYDTQVVRLSEFAMQSEDWVSMSKWKGKNKVDGDVSREAPPELRELEKEAERMCERATRSGRGVTFQEWAAFAARMRHELAQNGIHADSEAHDFDAFLLNQAGNTAKSATANKPGAA
jgi:catechol O-methyltransferase